MKLTKSYRDREHRKCDFYGHGISIKNLRAYEKLQSIPLYPELIDHNINKIIDMMNPIRKIYNFTIEDKASGWFHIGYGVQASYIFETSMYNDGLFLSFGRLCIRLPNRFEEGQYLVGDIELVRSGVGQFSNKYNISILSIAVFDIYNQLMRFDFECGKYDLSDLVNSISDKYKSSISFPTINGFSNIKVSYDYFPDKILYKSHTNVSGHDISYYIIKNDTLYWEPFAQQYYCIYEIIACMKSSYYWLNIKIVSTDIYKISDDEENFIHDIMSYMLDHIEIDPINKSVKYKE